MVIFEVKYTKQALEDLNSIFIYISNNLDAPTYAEQIVNRIEAAIDTLQTFPERYKLVESEPARSEGYRQIIIDNYISFYITNKNKNTVEIVRILHCRRDTKLKGKKNHGRRRDFLFQNC